MRNFMTIIQELKARNDDLSLDAATKLERQAELLDSQYSHDRVAYNRIFIIAKAISRAYDSDNKDKLTTEIIRLRQEIQDEQ